MTEPQGFLERLSRFAELCAGNRGHTVQTARREVYGTANHSNSLPRDLRAALALISELQAERTWRDIADAPRDGTHILLAAGRDFVGEAWWEDNDADPYPWKFIDTGMMGSRYHNKEDINGAHDGLTGGRAYLFTHWQPLPAPPPPMKESE